MLVLPKPGYALEICRSSRRNRTMLLGSNGPTVTDETLRPSVMSGAPQAVVMEMGFIRSLWSRAPCVLLPREVFTKGKALNSTAHRGDRKQGPFTCCPLQGQSLDSVILQTQQPVSL